MKKGSHKNQIIITTLALLLAVVGYISYDNRDTFMNAKDVLSTEIEAVNGKADTKESKECEDTQASDEVALETDSTEEILNAGETVLPIMRRKRVVLPAPLGPITPTMPLGGSMKLRSLKRTFSPNAFFTC